jgi:hypothetical protein
VKGNSDSEPAKDKNESVHKHFSDLTDQSLCAQPVEVWLLLDKEIGLFAQPTTIRLMFARKTGRMNPPVSRPRTQTRSDELFANRRNATDPTS